MKPPRRKDGVPDAPEGSPGAPRPGCTQGDSGSPPRRHPRGGPPRAQGPREGEDTFRRIADAARDAILLMDASGRIAYCNPSAAALFGYAPGEILGEELHALLVPERHREAYRRGVSRFRSTGQGPVVGKTLEITALGKDGTEFPVELSVSAVKIRGEWNAVGILRDISERRRAEERLKASEEKFRLLTETSMDFIFQVDTEGVILYCSPSLETILGYDPREITGTSLFDYVPDPDRSRAAALLRRVASGERLQQEEIPVRDTQGARVVLEVNAVPVRKGGDVAHVQGVARDITERTRILDRLRESEEKYRTLVENAGDAIFIFQDGRIRFHNRRVEEVTGYSAAELAGRPFLDLVHAEDRDAAWRAHRDRLEGKKVPPMAYRVLCRGGRQIWVEVSGVPISWRGRPAVLSFVRDITEQRNLEAQLRQAQKMEAVGRLAGGVAHDFNNVMAIVTGYSETLMQELGPDHPLYSMVEEILTAGRRAAQLTRQLLAFSRTQEFQPRVVDLNAEIRALEGMLRRLIGEDVALHTELAGDLWRVEADPAHVQQVLMNLAVNARDAMPEGGRITIRTANLRADATRPHGHPEIEQGDYAVLEVEDTGCGMDEETQARIFEPFFTTKEFGKGTGLGLSTVYGILKQAGGHIQVSSRPGRGTTFRIYLPRTDGEPAAEAPTPPGPAQAPTGSETILLVEDDPALRTMICEVLRRGGYEVLEAGDPEEAIRRVEEEAPSVDLLLTDVLMPKMSGPQLVECLGRRIPDLRVIYMSGYADHALDRHGIPGPGRAFLDKPFSPRTLLEKVRQMLDRAPAAPALRV